MIMIMIMMMMMMMMINCDWLIIDHCSVQVHVSCRACPKASEVRDC